MRASVRGMDGPPSRMPIGLQLAQTAKAVSRAFDNALATAGGSRPEWLTLLAIKTRARVSQRELATAVGIQGATLTHHLHAMEAAGLVTRARDPENRRVQYVELTPAGEAAFLRLREAAMKFDKRVRRGLTEVDVAALADLLAKLTVNVR
jgi:MarR family transcriptional regulator, transcriptional regulator for hemolysin